MSADSQAVSSANALQSGVMNGVPVRPTESF